jgi:hypothetical protein
MSTTLTALANSLPSDIPKLSSSGVNWAIFAFRFSSAVKAKGHWDHFDGKATAPQFADAAAPKSDELVAKSKWDKDKASAMNLLLQEIPNLMAMKIRCLASVKITWDAIVKEYTKKGTFAQTELHAKFLNLKCSEKANVCQFLDNLRSKREELVSVGADIDDKDYCSTISSSLPIFLSNFASSQLTAAKLYSPSKTIEPDALISIISEEFDHQKSQRARPIASGTKGSKDGDDEALAFTPGMKKKDDCRAKNTQKMKRTCWNCGEEGHLQRNCSKPKKDHGISAMMPSPADQPTLP